jgi:adenine-specific DNA-methyltransferase
MKGAEQVEPLDQLRFAYIDNGERKTYNLRWKDAEDLHDEFLRKDGQPCLGWLTEAIETETRPIAIEFDYTNSGRNFGFLNTHAGLKGVFTLEKLTHKGIENEEHLIMSVVTDDGTTVDDDAIFEIMQLPSNITGECSPETAELIKKRQEGIQRQRDEIADRNRTLFLEQQAKLEAYTEDLKDALQKYLRSTRKEISEKKKACRALKDSGTLSEMLDLQAEINKLETSLKKKQRELYDEEDRLEKECDAFLEDIRTRLNGEIETKTIMTFSFEIV